MSREKSTMELRDILNRIKLGHGIKEIHRDTKTHRTVIRKLRDIAEIKSWLEPGKSLPDKKEIYQAYYGVNVKTEIRHPLDTYKDQLKNYVEDGYSYVVMHELIRDRYACSESTVRRYVRVRGDPGLLNDAPVQGLKLIKEGFLYKGVFRHITPGLLKL